MTVIPRMGFHRLRSRVEALKMMTLPQGVPSTVTCHMSAAGSFTFRIAQLVANEANPQHFARFEGAGERVGGVSRRYG